MYIGNIKWGNANKTVSECQLHLNIEIYFEMYDNELFLYGYWEKHVFHTVCV